jgi:hypothetical protein
LYLLTLKQYQMKNIIQVQALLMLAFFLSLPFHIMSQDDSGNKEGKKVRIKTVKEVDGKKVVKDTTFYVSEDEDVKKVVKQFSAGDEADSAANIMVDVMVDTESDMEWEEEDGNKVIVIRKHKGDGESGEVIEKRVIIRSGDGEEEEVMVMPHGGHRKVMKFRTDDGEDVIIVTPGPPHGRHHTYAWKDDNGQDYTFDYDFDIDMENFQEDMARMQEDMREMQIRIMDEQGNISEETLELEKLGELEHLEDLERMKEMNVFVMPPRPPHAPEPFREMEWHARAGMEVSDLELREAGIKNKPDRLELGEIEIEKEDGVVDLSFTMAGDGTPKVDVYNVYGDKVFSEKPDLMNGKYMLKIDLSKKQPGTYYLMIVSGSSSKTMRLKN